MHDGKWQEVGHKTFEGWIHETSEVEADVLTVVEDRPFFPPISLDVGLDECAKVLSVGLHVEGNVPIKFILGFGFERIFALVNDFIYNNIDFCGSQEEHQQWSDVDQNKASGESYFLVDIHKYEL